MIQLSDEQFEALVNGLERNAVETSKECNRINKRLLESLPTSLALRDWLVETFSRMDELASNSSQLFGEVRKWAFTQPKN